MSPDLKALRLALVAVDRAGGDAGGLEHPDDLVGAMLGAAEHQRPLDRLRLQVHGEQGGLLGLVDQDDGLLDAVDGSRRRSDGDFGRVGQIAVGKILDRLRHGRREEQGLTPSRDQGDDPLQRMDEAEVEHLVGFVEHQDFEVAQAERALVDEVEQAAGRGDEDVEAAGDGAEAFAIGDAAEDDADRQMHEAAVGLGAGGDLRGQLAGRGKHQHARAARMRHAIGGRQPLQRRKHEGGGLAGAGLGDAQQVAAGQDRRNGLELDRRCLAVILGGERIEQGLGKPEGVK